MHKITSNTMLEKITDWLIERRRRRSHILTPVDGSVPHRELQFRRVLNTLRENKIMVVTKDDGIYIRLAGSEHNGEIFSSEFVRVVNFNLNKQQ
jgi:hypothetical protein